MRPSSSRPIIARTLASIPAALIALSVLALLAPPPAAAVAGSALVTRSLSGAASAPLADGEPGIVSISARDRFGRIVILGWAESAGGKGGGEAAIPSIPVASSVGDLSLFDIGRDSSGRVGSVAERKGGGPIDAVTSFLRDDSGRLIRVERREKGELAESLNLQWEGSGRIARLLLLDGEGLVKGGARLEMGVAGIADRTCSLSLVDGEGVEAGGLFLAWDSGGRLTRWEVRAPPGKAQAKGSEGAAQGDVASQAAAAPPGIEELLFPFWPRDAAGFELFAELAAPMAKADFGAFAAAGPFALPFDRPKEGAVEFLWDGRGRLLEGREIAASGAPGSSLTCRYDRRGLLVEEGFVKPDAVAASVMREESLILVYRLDAKGAWTACSSFGLPGDAQPGGLIPQAWFSREKIAIPLPGEANPRPPPSSAP